MSRIQGLSGGENMEAGPRRSMRTHATVMEVMHIRNVTVRQSKNARKRRRVAAKAAKTSAKDLSEKMKMAREQMLQDEKVASMMDAVRGKNFYDGDFAPDTVKMEVVDIGSETTEGPQLPTRYDPEMIAEFWKRRPLAVGKRVIQLASRAGFFLGRVGFDLARGKARDNEVKRAAQLRDILTSLGPAYIKLGQALSIRPDILSPAAMVELQQLCDKVPSFPNDEAFALLESELGIRREEIFTELDPEPFAAASLGQVYRGKLKNGDKVAVKIQRPKILETVAVDLFILRNIAQILDQFDFVQTECTDVLDQWASQFMDELDYVKEGQNGTKFAENLQKNLPQVVVPRTYQEYTCRRVLTTSWIEGEKLSGSTASDVGELVSLGVVCYLTQLLDSGFFHADPHPGNLLRTPDGRLAVIDFGLMTQLDDDVKYGMVEAIAHLIHRDYDLIVRDFVLLGFIPEGVDLTRLKPVLARVFDAALEGGGARNFNFQALSSDLAEITFSYPFRIPAFFALIIRAIGVLEGIALVGNPDFALVDSAFPYISRRLLTDTSPRLKKALRFMIYGRNEVFDAERLIELLEALEEYQLTASAARSATTPLPDPQIPSTTPQNAENSQPSQLIPDEDSSNSDTPITVTPEVVIVSTSTNTTAPISGISAQIPSQSPSISQISPVFEDSRGALVFMLSPEGAVLREFLLDECVKSLDAGMRISAVEVGSSLGISNDTEFPLPSFLNPFNNAPKLLPTVTEDDRKTVQNVQIVLQFLSKRAVDVGSVRVNDSGSGSIFDTDNTRSREQQVLQALIAAARDPKAGESLAAVAEFLPAVLSKLASRIAARTIREVTDSTYDE